MRIGIDGRYAEGKLSGIGQYIKYLATGLAKEGHEVFLFYTKKPELDLTGQNICSIVLPSNNRYLFEQYLLPKNLKKEKIELYHAAGNLGIPIFCPCPSALTIHDIIPLQYPNYFNFSKVPFLSKTSFWLRTAISIFRSKNIIADSQFTKDSVVDMFSVKPEKIKVIYLGVEEVKKENNEALKYGLKKDKYIINNGGINIRKNIDKLIQAFSKISKDYPEFKLVITGDDLIIKPKLQELAKKLEISDSVVFPGYVSEEELNSLLINAACLCFPSEIEGFGFPVLNSMALGVPVVASNTSSIPEIAGNGAILINPSSIDEITNGLRKVIEDKNLRNDLIKKGLLQSKKFTWEKTIDQTLEIYKEALK